MERMESGILKPSSFSFMLTPKAKFPPEESPTSTIRSPVVPARNKTMSCTTCMLAGLHLVLSSRGGGAIAMIAELREGMGMAYHIHFI